MFLLDKIFKKMKNSNYIIFTLMSGKIVTDANLITPSYCTSASPDYGAVSSKNVGLLFFCPLKIVNTFNPDP